MSPFAEVVLLASDGSGESDRASPGVVVDAEPDTLRTYLARRPVPFGFEYPERA
jgi:hypothetical protein